MTATHDDLRLVRLAGALYLVIILCGLTAELVLRGPLLAGSPEEVARALDAGIAQLRLSFLADTVMLLADMALALVFFSLLRHISAPLALAAMVFRLGQAVLIGASLMALGSVPMVLADAPRLAVHMTDLHAIGYDVGLILFAVNSAIMSVLLWRSAVPNVIAGGIAAAALVYAAGSLARLVVPGWVDVIEPAYVVPMVAESALCLWLLVAARL
ncbi:hypothetical protein FIU89_08230 [Roseovarius sp. THAF27]|uniref:DUF4386 domain-containing protein n=1 Tax=Roseovarius sp. THAF27 TaxID=2587850 RepID=UPI0012690B94|nr:DUF4386 domain-containing protein [Roseovarius sp. THAF27]QFT80596.1 hypothetical protein FIU89_08230 [Roseovarius sp. THAF27]